MPDHEWKCGACGERNPPYTEACRNCYTFAAPEPKPMDVPVAASPSIRVEPPPEPLTAAPPSNAPYVPNEIPLKTRAQNILMSIALIAYGTYGLAVDDLYVPSKHGRGMHLHGIAAWVMYAAFLSGCLVLLSVVVDHYDRRNNELEYKHFSDGFRNVGIGLFVVSLIIQLFAKP